jgi:heptosyltransferase III
LKKINKILIIIQRSNGDVLLSSTLIKSLYEYYESPHIDLLINEDTASIAKLIPFIKNIHQFSYLKKKKNKWGQEKTLVKKIYKKYDLSINLTASDRSVLYALFAGNQTISAVEENHRKSWWKKIFLNHYYFFDNSKHMLLNNLQPLSFLNISHDQIQHSVIASQSVYKIVKNKLQNMNIGEFFIFHPSAQYNYKIYPRHLRHELLSQLSRLDVAIVITGSKNQIDTEIKNDLSILPNIFDLIGETTLEEYVALSDLSLAYIGMDTLNMHIAASQNKPIFAIFGPTNLKMWSPWSNQLNKSALENKPIQKYGEITIFQANMPCVACGNAGCDDLHGKSECLDHISPRVVFEEVKNWLQLSIDKKP